MSTVDTVISLLSMPWLSCGGIRLSTIPLPGLGPDVIEELDAVYPGILSPEMRQLLRTSCGLEDPVLGSVDFTGRLYPDEPLSVFRPCLTLAVDDEGRRWIAETSNGGGLPGPVWCVLREPQVVLRIAHDMGDFLSTLHECATTDSRHHWLRDILAEARAIWAQRHALAIRPTAPRWDKSIRGWLAALPLDACVFDLRSPAYVHGWPYGLSGPSGPLYRCGRLPLFAVGGCPRPSDMDATALRADNDNIPTTAARDCRRLSHQALNSNSNSDRAVTP
jgi:hypothetical protein